MNKILALSTSIALAAAASGAWAQGVGQPSYYKGDIATFHGTPQSLINAIHALHAATGSKIVDIRFSNKDGLPGYHVVLQQGGRFTFMHIDEQGGNVAAITATSAPDWMLKWNGRAQLRFDRKAKVSLAQAIRTAEAADNNAPAVAAGIATSASNPESDVHAYNVILDDHGQAKRIAVDGTTGEIIANPEALSGLG